MCARIHQRDVHAGPTCVAVGCLDRGESPHGCSPEFAIEPDLNCHQKRAKSLRHRWRRALLLFFSLLLLAPELGCQRRQHFLTGDGHIVIFGLNGNRWIHHQDCPRCHQLRGSSERQDVAGTGESGERGRALPAIAARSMNLSTSSEYASGTRRQVAQWIRSDFAPPEQRTFAERQSINSSKPSSSTTRGALPRSS